MFAITALGTAKTIKLFDKNEFLLYLFHNLNKGFWCCLMCANIVTVIIKPYLYDLSSNMYHIIDNSVHNGLFETAEYLTVDDLIV